MLILHSADWHLGELIGPVIEGKNARLQDTLKCADYLVEYAKKEQPDVILISGDLFDKSKLWGDNMLMLIDAAASRLRELADIAPTVLLFGTDNHDSLRAYENIESMCIYNLSIISKPDLLTLDTESGPLQVAGLPGIDKGYFRAKFPGMAPADENTLCSQLLGDMVNGLSAQLDPTIPSVLMAHYTVVGCELDNGQHVFTQSEVVLPKEALAGSAFDLVALGHIHRAQQVECAGKPVFYSGAINGISFNEEGQDKGFYMHEIGTIETDEESEMPNYVGSEFVKTPYREFYTMEVDLTDSNDLSTDLKWFLARIEDGTLPNPLFPVPTVGKIVRLEYECTEEQRPLLNHKEMESLIKSGGAFHVSEVKAKRITTALVKQELTETSGPIENLYTWLVADKFSAEDIAPILELSKPFIETISAKMPTGTLSGVFEPRSLEVKNYRSYLEESLNFQDIFFATVNGPNGIGKSSFFMDAISDCLYEETRTGITGSWITNGQMDGMIQFEFSMGETNWRVIRNRSIKGSGKITLALHEYLTDKWEDRAGTTTRGTQEKIEALLGMDCATFRCTALIMQDAYGLFMEADKEARMGVLANILGLSIYDQLTDLAKVKVTELNKQIAISKAKLVDLDEKLKAKPVVVEDIVEYRVDLDALVSGIALKEEEIRIAEELVRTLKGKAERVTVLGEQIDTLKGEALVKHSEIIEKQKQAERAQQMLSSEATIIAKAAEYETVKDQILVLQTKMPKAQELRVERVRFVGDITALENLINKLVPQIGELEKVLASKSELDLAAVKYQEERVRLETMEVLAGKEAELHRQITDVQRDMDKNANEYNSRQTALIELRQKTAMLSNSGCIDSVNAKCAFLADAQKAVARINIVEAEANDINLARVPLFTLIGDLNSQYTALGYDSKTHYELRNSVNVLRPKAELASQLESKAELLISLREQILDYRKRITDLELKHNEVIKTSAILQDELRDLPSLSERLPKLLQWVNAKEELPAARQVVLSTADVIKGIDAEITVKEGQINAMEREHGMLSAGLIGLLGAEINVKGFLVDLKSLQTQQNDLHAKIGALTAQLKALAKDDADRLQLISDMEPTAKSLVHYQTLTKAFGLDGIPFSIVRSVVPELSYMANDILGQMTGGKMALEMSTERVQKNKKEVNALEVWITDYRGRIPYGDRSGGEKVKAALANAFALADLKARRVGIQLGMMFIDEPPFLDAAGADAYCDALEQLNYRYPNMRVIAISHDPAMKARFPQQIDVVDMGDEGSKVRIA